MISKFLRRRNRKGALAAEYVATMWLLFLFIFFPVLNLATVSLNAFFLWFACNQATAAGAKSQCFIAAVEIPAGSGTWFTGAYDTARAKANDVKNIFPGINWTQTATNPEVRLIAEPIDPAAGLSQMQHVGPGPWLTTPFPDPDEYTLLLRVTIRGTASPLIAVPWFDVPGLSKPMDLIITNQAQFENVSGVRF